MAVISVEDLLEHLSDVEVPILGASRNGGGEPARSSAKEIFANYAELIPGGVRRQLAAKKASGDRSKVLWKLSCQLLETGMTPGEAVVLLGSSVWNKFGEDRSRLWADVNKAAEKVGSSSEEPARQSKRGKRKAQVEPWSTPVDEYLAVESRDPSWMIEGLWSDKSHGIIAGEPKTRKSYVAIDIALSVATGTDCLGHFKVTKPGPVLMVQEEISDSELRKRMRYIASSKGLAGEIERTDKGISVLFPESIPMYLRNRQGCDLSEEDTFRTFQHEIEDKDIRLLILDPLQLMLGGVDENRASEVRPILYNFLQLKEATGCGILIVHHYSKASAQNPKIGGQRMLGSQAFHGWVESALYMTKPESHITSIEREFRNFEPQTNFSVEYVGGEEKYEVDVRVGKAPKRKQTANAFEKVCLANEGASVKSLAKHFEKSDMWVRRQVEKSEWVMLAKLDTNKSGRPKVVVVGRQPEA